MKTILYLFLLLVFSTILFKIMDECFRITNPSTDFLLSIIAVHLVLDKIGKYIYGD